MDAPAAAPSPPLVAGRECGTCVVCCALYHIPELQKPSATLCRHAQEGCTIYETRPQVCRSFFCLWRRNPTLDDGWRPDRSGVIIRAVVDGIPEHFRIRTGLIFDLTRADESLIAQDRFVDAVSGQVSRGVPVFLAIYDARGAVRLLVNEACAAAVRSGARADWIAGLCVVLDALRPLLAQLGSPA
jgi:hypothetical protein